jgi:hypothetical protein
MPYKIPGTSQRVFIAGMTGTGKTIHANWILSRAPWHIQPYTIIDYKNDPFFPKIEGLREIDFRTVPKKPGLYIMHPLQHQHEEMDRWFWKLWEKGRQGVYIDEGYLLPSWRSFHGFRTLLTQGRALEIPLITLTQRPVELDRFIISESDFYGMFHFNDEEDRKKVGRFMPVNVDRRLPEYHSYWYDVGQNFAAVLTPAPHPDLIAEAIQGRLDRLSGKRRYKTRLL